MRWKSRRGAGAAHRHEASRADTRSLAAVGALERGGPPPPRHEGSNPDPQRVFLAGGAQLAGGNEADSRATGPSGTAADSEITTCKAELSTLSNSQTAPLAFTGSVAVASMPSSPVRSSSPHRRPADDLKELLIGRGKRAWGGLAWGIARALHCPTDIEATRNPVRSGNLLSKGTWTRESQSRRTVGSKRPQYTEQLCQYDSKSVVQATKGESQRRAIAWRVRPSLRTSGAAFLGR